MGVSSKAYPTSAPGSCFKFLVDISLKIMFKKPMNLTLFIYILDSIIEKEDLENYNVVTKDSINVTLKDGSTLYTSPAPSGGPVLTFILNIMDGKLYYA